MRIVHVAAEFSPIAKAGGLGEMLVGLCRELARLSDDVEIIIPKYSFIPNASLNHLKKEFDYVVVENERPVQNTIWSAVVEGCKVFLIEPHHPSNYFNRENIYSYPDDISRFLYFSKAVFEYLKLQKQPIDILHLHDWHAAALAPLYRHQNELPPKAIILSIHNAEYQGICQESELGAIGLKLTPELKFQDNANLLKGAIELVDAVVAVSPTYAKEILTSEFGFGLDGVFRKHKAKIYGILNGIDYSLWNPEKDPHLPYHFSTNQSIKSVLEKKTLIRKTLVEKYRLQNTEGPWFGAITRLIPAKGIDLLEGAISKIQKMNGTFALLGASSIPSIQQHFETLVKEPNTFITLSYDDSLAHNLYAALDFLLVPSKTEPCGLTQMIGMRYGSIPIVHATGGLIDTVFDWENSKKPFFQRNGFLFETFSLASFLESIDRAYEIWKTDRTSFETLIRHAMGSDFSWQISAKKYRRLFEQQIASDKNREIHFKSS